MKLQKFYDQYPKFDIDMSIIDTNLTCELDIKN